MLDTLLAAHSPIASDELVSAVILQAGGTIGEYDGYKEFNRFFFWRGGSGVVKTMHQAKWLYG